ncbi:unnamed protein product [Ranitomeya imitator]|uniref:G-protein coupled receptors family 1 profile domain-containing protein n=1 Tax=Ranitomeya imitator TaxID=111125 RepID=A0ABN9MJH9_9NEOB|nr:unnamed protein product [Ranitomeya imitator]
MQFGNFLGQETDIDELDDVVSVFLGNHLHVCYIGLSCLLEALGRRGSTSVPLVGISDAPELQLIMFFLVLLIYLLTIGGNMIILFLVCLDPKLHTPMYFFLANLSVIDMFSTTVTPHNILIIFIICDNRISYESCICQMYFFGFLICDELLFYLQ